MEPQTLTEIYFLLSWIFKCVVLVNEGEKKPLKIPICKLILSRQKVGDIDTAQIIILIGFRRAGKGSWKRSHLAQFGS